MLQHNKRKKPWSLLEYFMPCLALPGPSNGNITASSVIFVFDAGFVNQSMQWTKQQCALSCLVWNVCQVVQVVASWWPSQSCPNAVPPHLDWEKCLCCGLEVNLITEKPLVPIILCICVHILEYVLHNYCTVTIFSNSCYFYFEYHSNLKPSNNTSDLSPQK